MGEAPFVFSDAIVLNDAEYASLSDAGIEKMKQERYDAWYLIANPPPPVEE